MKKIFQFCCLFLFAQPLVAQTIFDDCNDPLNQVECGKQYHLPAIKPTETSRVPDVYDVKYLRLELTVDPNVNAINGKVTTYFTTKIAGLTQIQFDLDSNLTVQFVKYHGQDLTFSQYSNATLKINLPGPIAAVGTLDSVAVAYGGTPPSTGFGSWNQTTHEGVPVIWTLSEPYGARDWWPCKQTLNDKADAVDIWVTTPAQYRVASNGLLVGETQLADQKIYHWQTHYPIAAYLIAIGVTNYSVYSNFVPMPSGNPLEVLNYVYPESLNDAQANTPQIIPVIQLYDSLTIKYPFSAEKYGHAQFNWGGGMEHQTMSYVINYGHELMNHECAHQWFGDYITCGSWQDIWLNEGFATYFEALTRQRFLPPNEWLYWRTSKIEAITSQPGGSVFCTDTTNVGRIFNGRLTYNKGAFLLHMLRWKLGDAVFFNGLKSYLNDPALAFKYARTIDLQHHLEQVSGQSLGVFFEQWFYGEGYPSYQVNWNQNGSKVDVFLYQTTSHPSVSFYEMPVPIRFSGEGHDTTLVFDHNFSGQSFSAELPFHVAEVTFDPELWILSANNSVTLVGTLNPQQPELLMDIFPNPASDKLTISLPESQLITSVSITNTAGQLIQQQTAPGDRSVYQADVSSLPPGLYTVQVQTNNLRAGRLFMKK
jgi:aminopeptidase N